MKNIISVLVLSLFTIGAGYNQAGVLDPSFDTDGIVISAFGNIDRASAIQVQPDGKIVAAGTTLTGNYNFIIKRFSPNGSLDHTFNGAGYNLTDFGGADQVTGLVIQPDGKVVVCGYSAIAGNSYDFSMVRYKANGIIDSTFDLDGKVSTAFSTGIDEANAIALQPDGKIVLTGKAYNGTNFDFGVARYNTDGSLDNSFDMDGMVTTTVGTADDFGNALCIQPDGKILVAGIGVISGMDQFIVIRYNTDGSLDNTFDTDGIWNSNVGASATGIFVQPDSQIVVGGTNSSYTVARLHPDGSFDNSFDGDGVATILVSALGAQLNAILLQPDGKIVAAGAAYNGTDDDFSLARFNSDGSVDSSFDIDGIVITSVNVHDDRIFAIAQQADGKLVVAGETGNGSNPDFVLARYISCSVLPDIAAHSSVTNDTVCAGDMVTLYGTGGMGYIWQAGITDSVPFVPASTQFYYLSGADMSGCVNTDSIQVTVNPLPDATISLAGSSITAVTAGLSYQWINCAFNTTIPGATSQSFTPTSNGSYAVIVSNNGCTDTSACQLINNVGLDEQNGKDVFSMFPNPSNGHFTVTANTAGDYVLVNALGQTIRYFQLSEGNGFSMQLSDIKSGTYYILKTGSENASKKVIIMN